MKKTLALLMSFVFLLSTGCATPTRVYAPYVPAGSGQPSENYATTKVFFATDRNLQLGNDPGEYFGNNRSSLRYGSCLVSIPRGHRAGDMEWPSIWKLEFRPDPEKHIVVLKTAISDRKTFLDNVAAQVGASGANSALLFVHGYNVSFGDAARRTAQMSYDLNFAGASVFYSWPSQASEAAYTVDEQAAQWSEANLTEFLRGFLKESKAQRIYLIAHSMGNRALVGALTKVLAEDRTNRERIKAVILAAPDIDADIFKRDIAPAITRFGTPVTLYASSNDRALMLSKTAHKWRRVGDSSAGIMVLPGIETVDASAIDTSLLGHSYYGDTRSVLSDISSVLKLGLRANDRSWLRPVDGADGRYWIFPP